MLVIPAAWRDLETEIKAAFERARAAYPAIELEQQTFASYLVARCDRQPADFLDAIEAAELYLVRACLAGDSRALEEFDRTYLNEVAAGARRLRCDDAELDDIRQEVRRMLLVGGEDAKLGQATARGDLRALIRLMALRAGISLRRRAGRETLAGDGVLELAGDDQSLGVMLAKQEHRALLSAALEKALAELEPKLRAVLKLHCLDGVGLSQLATMHQVDRSTISRWIARAREDIFRATRRHLASGGGVSTDQFDSFVDLVRSNFELSLKRMLER